MSPDQAAITWGEGLAALLTLGIITCLLYMEALVRGGQRRRGHHANVGRKDCRHDRPTET
jgi:hypothetical protein